MLGKIIALIAMRRSTPLSSALLQRLLSGVAVVLSLSLLMAFLGSVLLAGMICLAYHLLLAYGVSYNTAMMMMGIFCLATMLLLLAVIIHYVRRIKALAVETVAVENPLARRVSGMVYAFLDGLLC